MSTPTPGASSLYERAASEFLRAVRGRRSQVAFARRLGYAGNPITHWERRRRSPTAAEALRACVAVGMEVEAAFARFHGSVALCTSGSIDVPGWLDRLRGSSTVVEIAGRSGSSRFAVSRWLSGRSSPRLPEFFALVDAITGRLPELIAELVPIESVPALAERHRRARAARTLAVDEPWTEAVLRVLETDDYARLTAHAPGFVAERLGIDPELEARALSLLEDAGVVAREGERYRLASPLTVETHADVAAMLKLRQHWSAQAFRRAGAPREEDYFGYNVISVSRRDRDRIRERLRATFREIRSLVAASEPTEAAALVSLQLVSWDGPRKSAQGG